MGFTLSLRDRNRLSPRHHSLSLFVPCLPALSVYLSSATRHSMRPIVSLSLLLAARVLCTRTKAASATTAGRPTPP